MSLILRKVVFLVASEVASGAASYLVKKYIKAYM